MKISDLFQHRYFNLILKIRYFNTIFQSKDESHTDVLKYISMELNQKKY